MSLHHVPKSLKAKIHLNQYKIFGKIVGNCFYQRKSHQGFSIFPTSYTWSCNHDEVMSGCRRREASLCLCHVCQERYSKGTWWGDEKGKVRKQCINKPGLEHWSPRMPDQAMKVSGFTDMSARIPVEQNRKGKMLKSVMHRESANGVSNCRHPSEAAEKSGKQTLEETADISQ